MVKTLKNLKEKTAKEMLKKIDAQLIKELGYVPK